MWHGVTAGTCLEGVTLPEPAQGEEGRGARTLPRDEGSSLRSMWAKAQKGPRGQLPACCMSLHLVDL